MTRPYCEDLRERALLMADRGETIRAIGQSLQISPSCVSKWKKLRQETGALKPGKMNGHKKRVLSGLHAEWLRERIASEPFTLHKLASELAERGIKADIKAIWIFIRAEGLSYKKNRAANGTVTSGYCP
jgi:transposase